MTRGSSWENGVGSRTTRYETIVENLQDGVFALDPDGTFNFVNGAIEEFTGLDRDRLVGSEFTAMVESGLFDTEAAEKMAGAVGVVCTSVDAERRVTIETTRGEVLEVRLYARGDGTTEEIVGMVREVTERVRALETLEGQQLALQRLWEADVDPDLTIDAKIERALEIGCEFLDMPIGFTSAISGDSHRIERITGTDDFESGLTTPLQSTFCRYTVESDDPVTFRDAESELGADEHPNLEAGISCYAGTKILVRGRLYGTFCFAAADARDRSFSPAEREFVRLLGRWAGSKLDRQRTITVLETLHETGTEMLLADSKRQIAQLVVETVEELFDLPITALWRYDEPTDTLRPVAETATAREVIGETPVFERGEALAWESFETGEIRTFEDIRTKDGVHNPETSIRSEIHVPLGRQGVIVSASTEPRRFQNVDVESFELLRALASNALVDIDQQEALEERGEALQRQNEQLEEFAHVVAHDLRNPLAGAVGFLEIARETNDEAHFDRIETSLGRMEELIEELLDIARETRRAADPRELSLPGLIEEAWSYVDAEEATLTVGDGLGSVYADETRLLQLFGNLFRNSVEHAGRDVAVEVGALESGEGFYVEDDGPGLPKGAREDVLMIGRTASASGTGIGLDSVTDVVEAHGWELSIPETDGGARFEFRVEGATEAQN